MMACLSLSGQTGMWTRNPRLSLQVVRDDQEAGGKSPDHLPVGEAVPP